MKVSTSSYQVCWGSPRIAKYLIAHNGFLLTWDDANNDTSIFSWNSLKLVYSLFELEARSTVRFWGNPYHVKWILLKRVKWRKESRFQTFYFLRKQERIWIFKMERNVLPRVCCLLWKHLFVYIGWWAKFFLGWLVVVHTTLRCPLKAFIVIALRVGIDTTPKQTWTFHGGNAVYPFWLDSETLWPRLRMKNFSEEYLNVLRILHVIELHSKANNCSYELHCSDLVKARASIHSSCIIYYNDYNK